MLIMMEPREFDAQVTQFMITRRQFLNSVAGIISAIPSISRSDTNTRVGGLIVTGFRGTEPSDPEVDQVRRYLEEGAIAGVILLKRNVVSPDQLRRLSAAIRGASPDVSPIISIDQEGGRVARLNSEQGFLHWISAEEMSLSGFNDEDIRGYYQERAAELAALGINLNFGPVVDLNVNPENPIIGALGRSYGITLTEVHRFASEFVKAHRNLGVMTCLKHFPGHGSSASDSHTSSVDVNGTWQPQEMEPFRAMIAAELADAIMTSHVLHKAYSDDRRTPVSLSARSTQEIRVDLGFAGPIFTDDMQMGAITAHHNRSEAATAAVRAGANFLIYSNYKKADRIETAAIVGETLQASLSNGRLDPDKVQQQVDLASLFRALLI